MDFLLLTLLLVTFAAFAIYGVSLLPWTVAFLVYTIIHSLWFAHGFFDTMLPWGFFGIWVVFFHVTVLRQQWITRYAFQLFRQVQPQLSETEKAALDAGKVSWEGELFAGTLQWEHLFNLPKPTLTEAEQAFVDGPVEQLCQQINDWAITQTHKQIPTELWAFMKKEGFFGLSIPESYGGKGFSAYAHGRILTKLYSRSVSVATTVNVPNSLGPAELILAYGTDDQKSFFLPRLAKGEDIPCFALTGADAGSDAAAMKDHGIVCHGQFNEETIIGIRLNFKKRYITLAPVATLIALAFKLYDPEHLLGDEEERGITCALLPRNVPGLTIGARHLPATAVFANGPIEGDDVFIPLDWLIGGPKQIGKGWSMLMECLAAGRGIALPASAVGGAKMAAATSGAYGRIRRQFNIPIGQFEGVTEPLARIAGFTYMIDSMATLTALLVDEIGQPALPSAITKYHATELGRRIAMDAMDIHGGKGICMGPNNYLQLYYQAVPIGITVEGANILTRCMIIFGQGALRCHPYVMQEIDAALSGESDALTAFDKALFGHLGHIVCNGISACIHGLTRSVFAPLGKVPLHSVLRRDLKQVTRFSKGFAFLSDIVMLYFGGKLKRRELISARLADIFSYLYMASAIMKRFVDEGQPEADMPLVQWCSQWLLWQIQDSFNAILANIDSYALRMFCRRVIFPLGAHFTLPHDVLTKTVANLLQTPSDTRERLLKGSYLTPHPLNPAGNVHHALASIIACEPLEKRIQQAKKAGQFPQTAEYKDFEATVKMALTLQIIQPKEADELVSMDKIRKKIIAVDSFF
ncbi:MAG: acyl-CoA dehydrogenase [Gammaproteobacteria bacterium]